MTKRVLSVILSLLFAVSVTVIGVSAEAVDSAAFNRAERDPVSTGVSMDDPIIVPRVVVTTENGNGTALLKSDGYVNAKIDITDLDGSVLSDACTIKVRGNTTAFDSLPKKAFAFKFSKKKDVLGMGKAKKWVLLANIYDPSLLRNFTAFDMAHQVGLDYTSEQKFVELWLDGSYRGCYTLYEQNQQGKDRVDIDIDSNDGKKDFLIEYEDFEADEDAEYFHVDGLCFAVREPDDTTDDQVEYVSETMTNIINVLKTGDREQIATVIDIPSFAKYYFVNEFMKTMDFGNTSVYYYYKDGKLYGGPVWDFDKSSGSTDPAVGGTRALNTYKTDGIMQDQKTLYRYFGKQDWFVEEVRQVYEENYDYLKNLASDGGLLDSWREEYRVLFDRNFSVWNIKAKWSNYQLPPKDTYQENYDYFKNWLYERNSWLFDHFDLFGYEYLRGDADGNGVINLLDATVIQQKLIHEPVPNDDGHMALRAAMNGVKLSIADATIIQRYLISLDVPYDLNVRLKTKLREK